MSAAQQFNDLVSNVSVQGAVDVVPIGGRIGAEVRGVRLGADLDDRTVETIRAAWLKH